MSTQAEARPTTARSNRKETTTDRVARTAHDMVDETASKARVVEEKIRDKAEQAGDKVEATQDAATRSVREATSKAEAFAKEQPLAAAGIAFAAGALTAAILRR